MKASIPIIPLLFLFFSVSSCSKRHNFEFEPVVLENSKPTDLRIAVMPFADERQAVDEGSTWLAYIPLIPTSANVKDSPQNPLDAAGGNYYFPDLVAFGTMIDIGKNRLGSVSHFNPEATEDYDLIIDGAILSLAETDRNLTYGLSIAAPLTAMFGLPQSSKGIDFVARYRVRQPDGTIVYKKELEADWSSVQVDMPIMEGINSTIRENNTAFLEDIAPLLDKLAKEDLSARRRRYFYAAIDPELKHLDQERTRLIKTGQAAVPYFKRIVWEMDRRERWIEKYRQSEREILQAQQVHYFQKQLARLDKINQVRDQKRAIEHQQAEMERQANQAAMRGMSQALLAGVMPAMQSANVAGGGTWHSDHTMMALQDTANAMQAMPQIEAPPDLSAHIAKLNVSFQGLESAGMGRLQPGSSIKDIRRKFLSWYRGKITPLGELR